MIKRAIRVLVVDDSAFIRYVLTERLDAEPGISVVGRARDGYEALERIAELEPDVVTLDVEMPHMDGLAALKRIMRERPIPVVMLSAYTQRGARATIQALMRGAVDFVPKPGSPADVERTIEELAAKVRVAAGARTPPDAVRPVSPPVSFPRSTRQSGPRLFRKSDPVIVVGASTGGPRALEQVLAGLPGDLPATMAVVQHMPPPFTGALARRLDQTTPLSVREAREGDHLMRGVALLAPGGTHLCFNDRLQVLLDHGPRRNGVRPAADVTMESASEHHCPRVIGVVLTGMGADGTSGARCIKEAGGKIIAEHESTSVVYGMPRNVVEAGLADKVVPLPEVAPALLEMIG